MNTANVFDQIIDRYHSMSLAERRVADMILAHRSQIQFMTISELADVSKVSSATITRFCKMLGMSNYMALKLSAARANAFDEQHPIAHENNLYQEIQPDDSVEQKCEKLHAVSVHALNETLAQINPDRIKQAAELLYQARCVYCFGQGNSSITAMDAWGRFSIVTPKFHWIDNAHIQMTTAAILGSQDVVLYFSFSGATKELIETARVLKKNRVKLILVTRFPNAPGAAYADVVLICGANESPHQQGSVAARIAQLFLVDVLYHEYCAALGTYQSAYHGGMSIDALSPFFVNDDGQNGG